MLPRLLRPRLARPSFLLPFISRPPSSFPKPSANFRLGARSFQTSSPNRQRYQHVRFNDPYAQSSGSSGGKGGGRGYWQQLWARFTPGQRLLLIGFGGGAPIFYVTHLETVEPTGRRRFIFMSRSMEETLGKMVYEQTMQQFQGKMLPENNPLTKMCERVVARLGPVTGMEGVDWRVHVIDENVPNAFVIPGGQIFGILPIARNEDGLATILGHEIAHYTLRHIAEKNSVSQFFGIIGFFAAWMLGLPLDVFHHIQQVALELPNSRACETEADYVGLLYMAKACYDPEEGPKVWQRMTKMAKGQPNVPKFLSTHPQNQDRQERLRSHMEEARQKGEEAGCGTGFTDFNRRMRDMW